MNNGFIKVCTLCPEVRTADCVFNTENIIKLMDKAYAEGAKIALFPELSVTGYTCADLFLQDTLIKSALECLKEITKATEGRNMVVVVGVPFMYCGALYDCAAVINNGELLGIVPKRYLTPAEKRHFSHAPCENKTVSVFGKDVLFGNKAVFCCKELDTFTFSVEVGQDMDAPFSPSAYHTASGANIVLCMGAALYTAGKSRERREAVKNISKRLCCSYFYCEAGAGESTSQGVYGGQLTASENGEIIGNTEPFSADMLMCDADVDAITLMRRRTNFKIKAADGFDFIPFSADITETVISRKYPKSPFLPDGCDKDEICAETLMIQALGLKKRLEHVHADTAVLGISGGLDSTLAILVAVKAADMMKKDRKSIIAVTMPCYGTGERTKSNAVKLCEELGVTLRTVDIKEAVSLHFRDIGHDPENVNVVFENAQARERTQILMDIANGENGIVVGTGDLSELALGFATYNGDHMSMYGVNASVPKTLIRAVVTYCADQIGGKAGEILKDIVDTPVSPELLPPENGAISQKTEEIVGPYELHDFFIWYMIKFGFSPTKIYKMAKNVFSEKYSEDEIYKALRTLYRRFFTQQYKRSCLPDAPKTGEISFTPGSGWCMAGDSVGKIWMDEIDKLKK
ncbi:MAG: NAD(+) synthase [Clostridia bacterium]|nr:NAD(+) synthase [Clostridia bacterium]